MRLLLMFAAFACGGIVETTTERGCAVQDRLLDCSSSSFVVLFEEDAGVGTMYGCERLHGDCPTGRACIALIEGSWERGVCR